MGAIKEMGLVLVVVNWVLFGLATFLLGLRFYVRISKKAVGLDDWLMLTGWVLFTVTISATTEGATYGLGVHNYGATSAEMEYGIMYWAIWQLFYVNSSIFVKSSICITLLRITIVPIHRRILWAIIASSVISNIVACVCVWVQCRPMAFTWDKTIVGGKCTSIDPVIDLAYLTSAVNIITDWTCAILPAFIIWDIQMSMKMKLSVCLMLGMGVFASTATLVRLKTIPAYHNENDYLFGLAEIGVWSALEVGLAIMAGSISALRPLLQKWLPGSSIGVTRETDREAQERRNYDRSGAIKLRDLKGGMAITTIDGPERDGPYGQPSEDDMASQEEILKGRHVDGYDYKGDHGILVTQHFDVQGGSASQRGGVGRHETKGTMV